MSLSGGGLDCTKTPVFRGGGDLTPKYSLGEVKIKNGKVQPIRGVSLELDAADAAKHGVPHRVKSIPDELEIVQQGKRPGHTKSGRKSKCLCNGLRSC